MGNTCDNEWKKTLDYKAKNLAYDLHFHSMSHYISADKYEGRDALFTYGSTLSTAFGSAGVGSLFTSIVNKTNDHRLKIIATGVLLASTTTVACIDQLKSTDHWPAKKQDRHNKAAYRMKELCQGVEAWSDAKLKGDAHDEDMLNKFEEFVGEQRKIEAECIRSEDKTFKDVHKQLSQKWRALGEKLGKLFPGKQY